MEPAQSTPVALSIAGSDPSGGAGIQADLKVFSALSVYGAAVITALTAQNTRGVTAVMDLPADFVAQQLEAVLCDLRVDAIKIGMLSQAATIKAVAAALKKWPAILVVLDPVMLSKSGAALLSPEAVAALGELLISRATLLTPNIPEAAVLLGESEAAVAGDVKGACERLVARFSGLSAVLLKGGHLKDDARSDDWLFQPAAPSPFSCLAAPRVVTSNTHGTGCSLSSAIAAGLAHGQSLCAAVAQAKDYVQRGLMAADSLYIERMSDNELRGKRHGPIHHFFALWQRPRT